MLRIILAGVLVLIINLAIALPDGSSLTAANASGYADRPMVPQMMEFARANGTPTGPKAPGALYCFAPVDAKGELDFTRVRALGTVPRPVQLHEATVRAVNDRFGLVKASTKGSVGATTVASFSVVGAPSHPFFAKPVTAEEFCGLAQDKFENHTRRADYAWNIW